MNCKNCGHSLDGNFCSNCGQSARVSRINLPGFLNDISEDLLQVNRGFFFTLRELYVRPGESLREFLDGKRKNHFKPIAYVLTLSTLYFLIAQLTDQKTWIDDLLTGWMEGAIELSTDAKIPAFLIWLADNYAYVTLLLLPVFSLSSYLSFKKFGNNYLEHVVINSYITGQQAIIYSIFAFFGAFIDSDIVESLPLLIAIVYAFWVFVQLFSKGRPLGIMFRSILTYLLYAILSVGLLFVIMGMEKLLGI